ncbi:class II fructose-1,6-bisphosphate aldolase [Mycoplasmoides fastidiosum]|uniref:class II fructose-1,6-bisphosphate aldolase n=1 Tax=Mycoplasmoides fastidiosum TaxID=92758 RepID=UPI002115AF79|nr:class II fructose-1,6-bisphosphate aldolase [Mycoplasmoides fastidiosum]UUD38140.1 class II fructose-1,6-bisphosphate aldolase [Mycoplasmoides fastidiosum]
MLVNATEMTKKAYENKYAIPHININNLEWAKTVLLTADRARSPIIIATSAGAIKYMGGYQTVVRMVTGLIEDLKISIPVALHLDHGTYDACKLALAAGFSSIMFDGSHLDFADNLEKAKEIVAQAQSMNVSVEVEVGTIGGEEDGVSADGELADLNQCVEIGKLNISMLAAGIGNIHGVYPQGWSGLNFEVLSEISQAVQKPMVLHGGSGIPDNQIKKAISLGIAKINVNTELQLAFADAVSKYVISGKANDMVKKGFDPRKLLNDGIIAMEKVILDKIKLFGSANKA